MDHQLFTHDHDLVARLLSKNVPTAQERLWCVLSAGLTFDGSAIAFDGTPAELSDLRDRSEVAAMSGDPLVIWTPRQKRQRGRIPKALRCGFTVYADGKDLVAFQSVVFVPRPGVIDLIASTPSGQFVAVPTYHVASWDGSPVDDPRVPVLS